MEHHFLFVLVMILKIYESIFLITNIAKYSATPYGLNI